MENNYDLTGINGKHKRGGMFKRRLRGEGTTPPGSSQSHPNNLNGKTSQVSGRQLNPATAAINRQQSGSTSAATGSRNRLQMKQQQLVQYPADDQVTEVPKHETDLSFILRKRLEGIHGEMNDFNSMIQDFAYAVDTEMQNFTANMGRLQKNLNRVHMMKVEDESAPKKDKGGEADKS